MDESQSSKTERQGGKIITTHWFPLPHFHLPVDLLVRIVAITHRQNKQPNVNFSEDTTQVSTDCRRETDRLWPADANDKREANPVVGTSAGITPKLHPSKPQKALRHGDCVKDHEFSK